jgi:hypothetical protein
VPIQNYRNQLKSVGFEPDIPNIVVKRSLAHLFQYNGGIWNQRDDLPDKSDFKRLARDEVPGRGGCSSSWPGEYAKRHWKRN